MAGKDFAGLQQFWEGLNDASASIAGRADDEESGSHVLSIVQNMVVGERLRAGK